MPDKVTRTAPKSLDFICIFYPYILYWKTNMQQSAHTH